MSIFPHENRSGVAEQTMMFASEVAVSFCRSLGWHRGEGGDVFFGIDNHGITTRFGCNSFVLDTCLAM